MTDHPRFFAGIELALIFLLWGLTVWGAWRLSGATLWTAAGIFGLAMIVVVSASMRRPGWKDSGFRLDNFWPALVRVGLTTLCLLVPFAVAVKVIGFTFRPFSDREAISLLAMGVVQQAFFLGYLFQRWNALARNHTAAVILNAFSFAFVHLPHVPLVILTALAGLVFGALFIRAPNIFAIGLGHGVLSLLGGPMLYFVGILETTRIGPAELAPLAAKVTREFHPEDRLGIGPHSIGSAQFGRALALPVEPIGASYADEGHNREQLKLFLTSRKRVFCVMTENDFYRYLDPDLRGRIFLLDSRYILKRKLALNGEFLEAFLNGSGDVPVLGPFRERILLVSNEPSLRRR
jgi:hypothetical protein